MPKYIKARDIMEMLQISVDTLDRWIAKRKFPPPDLQISNVRMWEKEAIQKWLETHNKQSAVA